MVLASATYDAGLFPCMEDLLYHLKAKNFQNRTIGLIENGSWGPVAGKKMTEALESMKNITLVTPTVTIRSTMSEKNVEQMTELAKAIVG